MMNFLRLLLQKKWWNLLLLGFMNAAIYRLLFSVAFSYMLMTPSARLLLILPFIFLIWGLSSTSLSKFFYSTFLFIITFILGQMLFSNIYIRFFHVSLYPPPPDLGSGLGSALFLVVYIVMSFIAWIIALTFTLKARKRNDISADTENNS